MLRNFHIADSFDFGTMVLRLEIVMNWPNNVEDTLESMNLTLEILDEINKFRRELIFNPPGSGQCKPLEKAASLFEELKRLLK